ncbi:MAG: ADP-forming succinate--CoA ligase subunit beta [Planctomycetaceae bacterium]|nr:ADP-forming succinate--CoA ligase subunit beta [Planctomycetaceae bacterium]
MKIHEFQAKHILREAGVTVLPGMVVRGADEAEDAFHQLDGRVAVVKAQIHAGGRGKGTVWDDPDQRGVQLVRSGAEAARAASRLLGKKLITIQTGPEGRLVRQVLIEKGCDISRELYLGVVLDRAAARPVLMASSEGGVEIETAAAQTPEQIFREHFDPATGLRSFQVRKLCAKLGLTGPLVRSADQFMKAVCRTFVQYDCSLVETNPLVVTADGQLVALDAKMTFDGNGLFRHPEIARLRDLEEEDPVEVGAADAGLSYVKLDGNIGCLVNGAGLAMSTMDLIKLHGGEPANFLDVGGGADTEQVTQAFRILLDDPHVRGVLVNIFGGIARCTTIAQALLEASRQVDFHVPLVVRLEGTEVEEGRRMLRDSGLNIIPADSLTDAAQKIVAAVAAGTRDG